MSREEKPDELLVVLLVDSCPRCASIGMSQGIFCGTPKQVIVPVRDSESPFKKIRCTPCVLTGHLRDGCDTPKNCSSFFLRNREEPFAVSLANRELPFLSLCFFQDTSFFEKGCCVRAT
jgi:hypothetical protein